MHISSNVVDSTNIVCPWCGDRVDTGYPREAIKGTKKMKCFACNEMFVLSTLIYYDNHTKRTKCTTGECKLVLHRTYTHNNTNWCIWTCEVCHHDLDLWSNIVGSAPRVILPTIQNFKG